MRTRTTLYADEGKVLTNGTIYGKIIHLEEGLNEEDFREITDEEYKNILKAEEESIGE